MEKGTKPINIHFNQLPLIRMASPFREAIMHFLDCVKKCIIAFRKEGEPKRLPNIEAII
jgi:hypothetical protein